MNILLKLEEAHISMIHYMLKNIKTYTIIDSESAYKDIVKLRSKFKGMNKFY